MKLQLSEDRKARLESEISSASRYITNLEEQLHQIQQESTMRMQTSDLTLSRLQAEAEQLRTRNNKLDDELGALTKRNERLAQDSDNLQECLAAAERKSKLNDEVAKS